MLAIYYYLRNPTLTRAQATGFVFERVGQVRACRGARRFKGAGAEVNS
jgi:hypothetical protein